MDILPSNGTTFDTYYKSRDLHRQNQLMRSLFFVLAHLCIIFLTQLLAEFFTFYT